MAEDKEVVEFFLGAGLVTVANNVAGLPDTRKEFPPESR
jgi:hypothetical protein